MIAYGIGDDAGQRQLRAILDVVGQQDRVAARIDADDVAVDTIKTEVPRSDEVVNSFADGRIHVWSCAMKRRIVGDNRAL